MPSERIQRRIDALLEQAEEAIAARDWAAAAEAARAVLGMDPDNEDAPALLRAAEANLGSPAAPSTPVPAVAPAAPAAVPESFAAGRYHVRKFLGEGGKKRVFLAHDALLDRDVAFALIKTEGLDATGRERITREAQAMGRMGAHPHMVSVFDLGEEGSAPYIVTELMGGGDVEGEIEKAGGALALPRALEIATGVARGLVFAHGQGIVHRDLKPGNVWLTTDGVAKIGDFGLAVAQGRSRLTQHGLMVGTFGYMPPEQALGGEATPQSDLYSLGAMLYEMVTGKRPFEGDSPTAVISQHLNATPVAPSWHTEHCPPPLEDLILTLLAKEPAQRPVSAAVVVASLEGIDTTQRSRSRSDSAANPLDRLARGVFVGRERELERLRAAFDEAMAGRGQMVMVVGEPGIGKTRTTSELETYARMRGAKTFWGRTSESGGAPPYWAWTQVGRAYRDQTAEEIRRKEWQPYAVDLQRLFPALRDLFPDLPEPPPVEDESAQFRLFDAFSAFLRSVAEQQPLLIVLDDLHWADGPTLAMLTHLAKDIARARILVIGTYRDTDLDRQHPLSRTLGELNRESLFTRINLRGLTQDEVGEYIRTTAQIVPPPGLVQRVHEETEGNAFFLSEVVNLMTQEGTLTSTTGDVRIPEGVKEALGRRLDRLSPEANGLLSLAAVIGREFEHDQLVVVAEKGDDEVLRLMEEALAARVLEETGQVGRYRFTHALMQETLLGELSTARRVRLHGQIAEALDVLYGDTASAHAPELAAHYIESSALNRTHARLAARYSRLAAEQATATLAYGEAARHYEHCIELAEAAPDRFGEDLAALWTEVAWCRLTGVGQAGTFGSALDRALAVAVDPSQRAASLVRVLGEAPAINADPYRGVIAATLAGLDRTSSRTRVGLLALFASQDYAETGDHAAAEAEVIAMQLGLQAREYPITLRRRPYFVAMSRGDYDAALVEAQRALAEMTALGYSPMIPLVSVQVILAFRGEVAAYVRATEESISTAAREGRLGSVVGGRVRLMRIAWSQGRESDAAELSRTIQDVGWHQAMLEADMAERASDLQTAVQLVEALISVGGNRQAVTTFYPAAARLHLALGDRAAAQARFDAWRSVYETVFEESTRNFGIGHVGLAICELADEGFLREIAAYLKRHAAARMFFSAGGPMPDTIRGTIALKLGDVDEAERHFRTGFEWASSPDVRFEVDAGRCLQGLAEVAERRGDHTLAMEHLDAAGELFARHGAKLFLDQVIAKKEILKA